MTDVQGLCHIGAAVVHHDGLSGADLLYAEVGRGAHFLQITLQEGVRQLQVDKAGHYRVAHGKGVLVQFFCYCVGNGNGRAFILLGGRQRAVTLVFAQVRAVGNGHSAKGGIVACVHKSLLHFCCNHI